MCAKRRSSASRSTLTPAATPSAPGGHNHEIDTLASKSAADDWAKFQTTHAARANFTKEPVYALPVGLIDALVQDARGLLTKDDQVFERQLAALGCHGFAFGRPIFFSPLAVRQATEAKSPAADKRHAKAERAMRDLLTEELRREGRSDQNTHRYFLEREALNEKARERQAGYVGWLVTNAEFRKDRDRFRKRWGDEVDRLGGFPKFPISYFGEKLAEVKQADREFYSDYVAFYRKWCLDTFATWDLPVPMRSDLTDPSLYSLSSVTEAGIVAFLPWYLLRRKDITLQELAKIEKPPAHLRPWVMSRPKNWGPGRLSMILELYVYCELALKQRYCQRLDGKSERIDLALSRYYMGRRGESENTDQMVETIRKARRELNRRLDEHS